MTFNLRLQPPPHVPKVTVQRIVDILRIAAASHHRLISYIDPKTQTTHPLGRTAADFELPYRVVRRKGRESWAEEFQSELNTNFHIGDTSRPLWRATIIAGEGILRESSEDVPGVEDLEEIDASRGKDDVEGFVDVQNDDRECAGAREDGGFVVVNEKAERKAGGVLVRSGGKREVHLGNDMSFDVMFSFHHCLGT